MDRTEAALRKLLVALPSPGYDLGVLTAERMQRFEALPASAVYRMIRYLKYRNAQGAHIFLRPTGESAYTLLDDLNEATLARLSAEGFAPAAIVETSPGNYQAWLRHAESLPKELGSIAARLLAERFAADGSAADWRRFGRAPGFTNRKPQHRTDKHLYPFARLHASNGQTFPAALAFREEVRAATIRAEQERWTIRLSFAAYPQRDASRITLARFRALPRSRSRSRSVHVLLSAALSTVRVAAAAWPGTAISSLTTARTRSGTPGWTTMFRFPFERVAYPAAIRPLQRRFTQTAEVCLMSGQRSIQARTLTPTDSVVSKGKSRRLQRRRRYLIVVAGASGTRVDVARFDFNVKSWV